MARRYVSSLSVGVSCPAATAKTLVQLRAGVIPVTLVDWGVSFNGINSSLTPAQINLVRQTTGGTMTQIGAGIKLDSNITASLSSYRIAASAEPTGTTDIYESQFVTPVGGLYRYQWPLGREITINPGERVGLVVTAGASSAATALGHITYEE